MSEAQQLDQMLSEIAGVEEESKELDEEQKQLKLKAKSIAEKIIQELRKRNRSKLENVNKLQSKINDLESQLKTLSALKDGNSDDEQEGSEVFVETLEQAGENSVTVVAVEEEENTKHKKQERKKRGVF